MENAVIMGDSIFKGVLLDPDQKRYYVSRELDWKAIESDFGVTIKNLSKMGCRTSHALNILKNYLDANEKPNFIVIELGGNDSDYDWKAVAKSPSRDYLPFTPPEEFQENYRNLIRLAKQYADKVLLVNLPPVDEKRYFEWIAGNGESRENILYFLGNDIGRIYRDQEMYSERIGKLANEFGCELVDIRYAFLKRGDFQSLMCRDGIHPNSDGHKEIIKAFGNELAVY